MEMLIASLFWAGMQTQDSLDKWQVIGNKSKRWSHDYNDTRSSKPGWPLDLTQNINCYPTSMLDDTANAPNNLIYLRRFCVFLTADLGITEQNV